MNRLGLLLAFLLALLGAAPASAHLTPNSEIALDFADRYALAKITIPLGELGYAVGRPVPVSLPPGRTPPPPEFVRYVVERTAVRALDGRPWRLQLLDAAVVGGTSPDFVAQYRLEPPAGAPLRRFDLAYSAVIDRVASHIVLVYVKTDFAGGTLSERPRLVGGLHPGTPLLRVDRGPGSAWRGFVSAIGLGMHHIAEGHDHLLFLLALLLPAPLVASGRRWVEPAGLRATLAKLAAVVSAFTVGHSITLIGGAFFGWRLPPQPVEVGIAISILVSAVHAWRPLFAGREPWVAGGFGLVHGLAFATLIGRFGLEPLQKAQSILGFNVGIELVQLAVVAVAAPLLVVLSRTRSYGPLRTGAAAFAGLAAIAWIAERTLGTPNPVADAIDAGMTHWPWGLAWLAGITALAVLADRRLAPRTLAAAG